MGVAEALEKLNAEAEQALLHHGKHSKREQSHKKGRVAIRALVALALLADEGEGTDTTELQKRIEFMHPGKLVTHANEMGMRPDFAVTQALRDLASGQRAAISVEKLSESGNRVAITRVKSLERVCEHVPRAELIGPPQPKQREEKLSAELKDYEHEEAKLSLLELAQRPTALEAQGKQHLRPA